MSQKPSGGVPSLNTPSRETNLKQGWLYKQGGSTGKVWTRPTWKKRWVALGTKEFSYYKKEEHFLKQIEKLGFVHLENGFELKDEVSKNSGENLFSLNAGGRKMFLRAETPAIKQEWLDLMERVKKRGEMSEDGFKPRLTLPNESPTKMITDNLLTRLLEAQDLKTWEDSKTYKEGYLMKRGGALGKASWKKRWVVLDSEGVCYFPSQEVCVASGAELGFMAVGPDFNFEEAPGKDDTCFTLSTATRTLYLKAEGIETRKEWMKTLVAYKATWAASAEGQMALTERPPVSCVPQALSEKLVNPESIQEGYLTKLGEKHKSWKRRYFVLVKNELQYHKHPKEKKLGTILLTADSVCQAARDMAFTFYLVPQVNGRSYLLSAKDTQDQVNWLHAFGKSVPEMKVVARKLTSQFSTAMPSAGASLLHVTRRSPRSLKEGFLLVQVDKAETWKRRYFVLLPSSLEYYKNPHDKQPKSNLLLSGGDLIEQVAATNILCTVGTKKYKLLLNCETIPDAIGWLTSFQATGNLIVRFTP